MLQNNPDKSRIFVLLNKTAMKYSFSKTINSPFEETLRKVTEGLQEEGFGILTEIDVHNVFKNKLNVDFRKYKILGACIPDFAYKALHYEDEIGIMLPCNVILQEIENQKTKVSAVDPVASMMAVQNENLEKVAAEVAGKLRNVIKNL